jgi:hypothetical protein
MTRPIEAVADNEINTMSCNEELEIGAKLSQGATFPADLERRVRRKLDWNIIPLILAIYMLSVLDRSNIGNAEIAGMHQDLNLYGNRYTWLLNIFYIPCTFLWLRR